MTSNNCGIYKITNTVDGKFYIGSSTNIFRRWREHKSRLRMGKHHSRYLQNAWNKYGEELFSFEVALLCEVDDLCRYEQAYIDALKPEYNIAVCAEASGRFMSDETKRKIGDSIRKCGNHRAGVKLSEETKRKMSEAHKALWTEEYKLKHRPTEEHLHKMHEANKGRHHTEETRRKLSEANKGKHLSDETKRKLSEANKGKHLSDETKRKQSEALKGRKLSEEQILQIIACNTGRKHTEETRKHMSEAHIGKPSNFRGKHHTEESRRKMSEAQHKRHKDHPATEETRRKLSEAQKGHPNYNLEPPSEETKRKTSESLKRYWAERKLANANTPTPDCYRTEKLD